GARICRPDKRSASGICHHCRMRRERLIRPTNGARICRPDKRSASGICHHCRMRRERLIRPTSGARIVGLISVAHQAVWRWS
ncbi:hypothetical protein AWP68_13780, partial [Escherichia coli]